MLLYYWLCGLNYFFNQFLLSQLKTKFALEDDLYSLIISQDLSTMFT